MDTKTIAKFIKEKYNYFPACKIIEYENSDKYNFKHFYKTIKSNEQILAIKKISKMKRGLKVYNRLLELLSKKIRVNNYRYFLQYFLQKNLFDNDVYGAIYQIRGGAAYECTKEIIRSQIYYCLLRAAKIQKITKYIDMGCGECVLGAELGKLLGLKDSDVYGADIPAWGNFTSDARPKSINFIELAENKILPIKSGEFDLVSFFMVLHHVKDLELMMREVRRITRSGGYVIIREHDCRNYADAMLIDIEHMLFDIAERNNMESKETYYGKYYNIIEWAYMFDKYGFDAIYTEYVSDSVNFEITPTRAYVGIFKKR